PHHVHHQPGLVRRQDGDARVPGLPEHLTLGVLHAQDGVRRGAIAQGREHTVGAHHLYRLHGRGADEDGRIWRDVVGDAEAVRQVYHRLHTQLLSHADGSQVTRHVERATHGDGAPELQVEVLR